MENKNNFNKLIKAKNGYILYNRFDKYIGRSIEEYGEFSEFEAEIFRQVVKEKDTVIEVGANIGTHTLIFSNLVGNKGKVIAFEPQRIVFQTLCANVSLNSKTNVYAFQNAVSNQNGYLHIPFIDYGKTDNFGGISLENINDGEKVEKVKLDNFLTEYFDLDSIKLIKIDVEGMEKDVLEGAKETIKKFSPILYLENDRQDRSKELMEYIDSLGYKMFWHLPPLYNPKNFFKNQNNIFSNLVSVNLLCLPKNSKVSIQNFVEVKDFTYHPMRKQ